MGPLEFAPIVEIDRPKQGLAIVAGEEAARPLADHLGIQRGPVVWGVEGDPAAAGFGVDRVAGGHEGGDVVDRVEDAMSVTAPGGEEGLIEVARPLGIDGDEVEVAGVAHTPRPAGRDPGPGRGGRGGRRRHRLGELRWDVEASTDAFEPGHHARVGGTADRRLGHGSSVVVAFSAGPRRPRGQVRPRSAPEGWRRSCRSTHRRTRSGRWLRRVATHRAAPARR